MSPALTTKRFAAIVLPELACELARSKGVVDPQHAFGLIVDDGPQDQLPIKRHELLAAVDSRAFQYGVRPGQRVSEACAFVGGMQIARLRRQELNAARGLVAELAMRFGTTAALALNEPRKVGSRKAGSRKAGPRKPVLGYPLGAGAGPLDTVWLDITGCSGLHGGEAGLCRELSQRIHELGHRCRIAVADGPRLAQAIARWEPTCSPQELLVDSGQSAQRLAALPTAALPLDLAQLTWLSKLGVLRIADLARLDRPRLAHRLGPSAQDLLQLIAGRDRVPLLPFRPPGDIIEQAGFDEPMSSSEPLLFVLRGLVARAIARLDLRGQACRAASLTLRFDPGVVALHQRCGEETEASSELRTSLPVPLCREEDLQRALHAKLERAQLPAPVVEIALTLEQLTERPGHQLDLGQSGEPEPTALPTLLAELSAWLGAEQVGTLQLLDDHQPERRSRLAPVTLDSPRKRQQRAPIPPPTTAWRLPEPTRILSRPIDIGQLRQGELLATPNALYTIDELSLLGRIDLAHWWTPKPICRDYARGVLRAPSLGPTEPFQPGRHLHDRTRGRGEPSAGFELNEAWAYIDRQTGRGYLHGWFD